MITVLKKYSLFIFSLLLLSGCANKAVFEWIKINPDKLKAANIKTPYQQRIKEVDITIALTEKRREIYFESPEAYIKENPTPAPILKTKASDIETGLKISSHKNKVAPKPVSALYKTANNVANRKKEKPKTVFIPKEIAKKPEMVKSKGVEKSRVQEVSNTKADKLNGALKMPKKTALRSNDKTVKSTPTKKITLKQEAPKETVKKVDTQIRSSKPDKAEAQILNLIKSRKGNSFMLAGMVLAVVGAVLGLIFGKTAYLISAAGVVFAAIGYMMKV